MVTFRAHYGKYFLIINYEKKNRPIRFTNTILTNLLLHNIKRSINIITTFFKFVSYK